jgi:hypothetical protein
MKEGEKQFNQETPPTNQSTGVFYDNNGNYDNQRQNIDKRTVREKLVAGSIVLVAFVAVFFGYYQLSTSIKKPFTELFGVENVDNNNDDENCINGDCQLQAEILATLSQQQKDTDKDGLSDYDELNIHGTSPYLEDSDSDGFTDKEEVDGGFNPNCPGEDDCLGSSIISPNTNTGIAGPPLSGPSSADDLRNLLLQGGFPVAQLNDISDDQLVLLYQQAISGEEPNFDAISGSDQSQNISTSPSQSDQDLIAELSNLTGEQIRQLMIEQGAPESILSQVSDDELRAMFLSQLELKASN